MVRLTAGTLCIVLSSVIHADDFNQRLTDMENRLEKIESLLLKLTSSSVSTNTNMKNKAASELTLYEAPIMEIYALSGDNSFPSKNTPFSNAILDNAGELFKFTNYLERPDFKKKYYGKPLGIKWSGYFLADTNKKYVFNYHFKGVYSCTTELRINGKTLHKRSCPNAKLNVTFPAKSVKFQKQKNLIEVWMATGYDNYGNHEGLEGKLTYRIGRSADEFEVTRKVLFHEKN